MASKPNVLLITSDQQHYDTLGVTNPLIKTPALDRLATVKRFKGVILDLDGTVYCGDTEVPGAAAFVDAAHAKGIQTLFVTNRANRTPSEICRQLKGFGIACSVRDVFTSAQATAAFLKRGTAWCIGEKGLKVALKAQGIRFTASDPDFVIVSYDRSFDYAKLATASRLIRGGAKFIATNADPGLPTDQGLLPGSGSIIAAVEKASGTAPLMIGKPEPMIVKMALKHMGLRADEVLMVGDNLLTDIPAGKAAGVRTALMLTGYSDRKELRKAKIRPTWVFGDFGQFERFMFG